MAQDLGRIRAFVQVHEAGGFSAAARQNGKSKALLSKYVTDLEDQLGVRLMNRTTRKLSLTQAGETYYGEVTAILNQLEDLDALVSNESQLPRGLLRISAPRHFGERSLGECLNAFMIQHRDVALDLRLEDRYVDMIGEGLDLALRDSAMPASSMIGRKIVSWDRVICASPAFLAEHGTPKDPDDLRKLPCILDVDQQGRGWRLNDGKRDFHVQVAGRIKTNSPVVMAQAAVDSLGVGYLPVELVRDRIAHGELVPILQDCMQGEHFLQAVYPHRRHLAGKVRALIDHLVAWYEKHPAY